MSVFDSLYSDCVAPAIGSTFGETIILERKTQQAQTLHDITVFRKGNQAPAGNQQRFIMMYEVEILVPLAVYGKVNTGGDKVTVKKRLQDAEAAEMLVVAIVGQEGGCLRLGLK